MDSRLLSRLAVGALALQAFAGQVEAQEAKQPAGVIELFTSQGCSSCPPADALFGEIAARNDIVALAYHVDYWDYLGWRDTLARPENTARQYDYGKSLGIQSVYTPQAVINGRTHVNGANRLAVSNTIEELRGAGQGMTVGVTVTKTGDSVIIDTGAASGAVKEAHVVLVYYDPVRPVVIDRGENKGETVNYWNAVSDVQIAGMWHGEAARFEMPASEIAKKGGCAVLLQSVGEDGLPGPILGAAIINSPTG